jgi:hypothetical protein
MDGRVFEKFTILDCFVEALLRPKKVIDAFNLAWSWGAGGCGNGQFELRVFS